jgi:hypothetical protein
MAGNEGAERHREKTRRIASAESVFLPALAGTGDERARAVVRNDVYMKAVESARKVLRTYYSERKRNP